MFKMVDGTGIIGVDMICPLGISTPQPPNYDRVELEGTGMLVLPNSLDAPLERLELGGKTEQVQTSGKNLFDIATCPLEHDGVSFKIPKSSGNVVLMGDFEENTQYTLSVQKITSENANSAVLKFDYTDGTRNEIKIKDLSKKSLTSDSAKNVKQFVLINPFGGVHEVSGLQLEKGTTATPYEPYTGGKPSPSPEYPQEIKSVGKLNADTQKYEVSVKLTGKNLFDREKASEKANWTRHNNFPGYYNFPVFVGKDNTVTISIPQKIPTGQGLFLSVCLSESGGREGWIAHNSNASLNNAKLTYKATTDYIYLNAHSDTIAGMERFFGELQIECGNAATPYQPYTEQTLTITSDRPITKWDRLIEQGGEIGWLYGSEILQFTDAEGFKFFHNAQNKAVVNVLKAIDPDYSDSFSVNNSYCTHFINNIQAYYDSGDTCSFTLSTRDGNCLYFKFGSTSDISDLEKFEKWILEKRPVVIYKTKDLQFIPLPQSEQNAIRALKTYYPTTVITVDGGELDPDIKVTYRKEI